MSSYSRVNTLVNKQEARAANKDIIDKQFAAFFTKKLEKIREASREASAEGIEDEEKSQEESAPNNEDFSNLDRELLGDQPANQDSPQRKDLTKMLFGRLGIE